MDNRILHMLDKFSPSELHPIRSFRGLNLKIFEMAPSDSPISTSQVTGLQAYAGHGSINLFKYWENGLIWPRYLP